MLCVILINMPYIRQGISESTNLPISKAHYYSSDAVREDTSKMQSKSIKIK